MNILLKKIKRWLRLVKAFFRLIRWPNLLFVLLSQYLFAYGILLPIYQSAGLQPNSTGLNLLLITLSSILIAAGGYIINDYFDVNIDRINKPHKLIIGRYIHRHWAIACHITLSLLGIGIGIYLDCTTSIHFLGFFDFITVLLLFWYSISLKRQPLSGNVLVAVLSAWSIMIITWCETVPMLQNHGILNTSKISRFSFLYTGFAFIISLIREVIKDMEDIEGDRKLGCKTIPIVWGMTAAKVFAGVWLVVLIGLIAVVQFYVLQFKWFISASYCILCILLPAAYIFRKLILAQNSQDYHQLSRWIKWVMLTGILSMAFIHFGI